MSDRPLFQNTDEQERVYAPEGVPGTQLPAHEIDADGMEGRDTSMDLEPPSAAPVAHVGTTHTGQAAPAGVEDEEDDVLRADVGPFGSDPDDGTSARTRDY
jgi:hypothetical protein